MTGRDSTELQTKIENNCQQLQNWMDRWNLLINYQKTEIVVFKGNITSERITSLTGEHPTYKPSIHQRAITTYQRIGKN